MPFFRRVPRNPAQRNFLFLSRLPLRRSVARCAAIPPRGGHERIAITVINLASFCSFTAYSCVWFLPPARSLEPLHPVVWKRGAHIAPVSAVRGERAESL